MLAGYQLLAEDAKVSADKDAPTPETEDSKQTPKTEEPGKPEYPDQITADIFVSGKEGYNTYRVPAIAVTKTGSLLAFCEGRKNGRSDTGDIDIVMKRSSDGGKTWSDLQVVFDDKENTAGNPCVVIDRYTGRVWLLSTWNNGHDTEAKITTSSGKDTRRVFVLYSDDGGETWSEPRDITESVKRQEWTWYATGPGTGIQLRLGEKKGRLVIPCDHKLTGNKLEYHSHVIYSDDHGETWQIGGSVAEGTNECHVIERTDESLMINMRRARTVHQPYRMVADSNDGGESWSEHSFDEKLIGPRCQSSFIRYTPSNYTKKKIVLHCNPASKTRRVDMTVRASFDDGATWSSEKLLYEGPSAYSSMAVTPDGTIVATMETGKYHPYEQIRFKAFSLDWLTDGKETNIPPATIARKYTLDMPGLIDKAVHAGYVPAAAETENATAKFVAYEPNMPGKSAVVVTNPITVYGEMLCVDTDIKEGGSLRVVIADEQGNTLSSSRAVRESAKECRVIWSDGWQFASIKGKKIRLKFVFEKARLNGFYIK